MISSIIYFHIFISFFSVYCLNIFLLFCFQKCEFSSSHGWLRKDVQGTEFILHDGPPFANRKPHMGKFYQHSSVLIELACFLMSVVETDGINIGSIICESLRHCSF